VETKLTDLSYMRYTYLVMSNKKTVMK